MSFRMRKDVIETKLVLKSDPKKEQPIVEPKIVKIPRDEFSTGKHTFVYDNKNAIWKVV